MQAESWPSWRGGADGAGVAREAQLPRAWSPTQNVRWRVELPERGNSTPVIWAQRVFVTQSIEAQNKRTVLCLNRADGKVLWQRGTTWTKPEASHDTNPYCSASPVTDGERVIAWFGSAGLFAYDFEGKELWHRDLGALDHEWGYGSSPLLHGDLCILYVGPGQNQRLMAVDKRTGQTMWQAEQPALVKRPRTDGFKGQEEGGMIGSFSSPIVVQNGAQSELIMTYPQRICAYDPKTGKELWRCDGLNELVYASPVAEDGVVVGMGGFLGTSVAVKAGGRGEVTATHRLWSKERTKNRLGSAVVHQGHIYILNSDGIAECIELKTGRVVWEERLPKKGRKGDSWSSMVLAGDLIYILNQSADTVLLKAAPEFSVVGVNALDGALTNASLAVSDGELYIRTHTHLWCIASGPQTASR